MGEKRTRSSRDIVDDPQPAKRRASGDAASAEEENANPDKVEQSPKTITNGEPQTPQQEQTPRVAASPASSISSRQSHGVPTVTRNLLGGDLILSKSNIWTLVYDPVIATIFPSCRIHGANDFL